jgi:hypothetical protein
MDVCKAFFIYHNQVTQNPNKALVTINGKNSEVWFFYYLIKYWLNEDIILIQKRF